MPQKSTNTNLNWVFSQTKSLPRNNINNALQSNHFLLLDTTTSSSSSSPSSSSRLHRHSKSTKLIIKEIILKLLYSGHLCDSTNLQTIISTAI